ncbi:hypothetical protein HMN09_00914600 [Mycena chlorophos]|uniref:Uncharacterized protein n=1 Tax=Mycena chlorophos TaxID=658473 RepID=A0A8H6SIL7_MYCCL|nr:hypothetical protein HMN09_00914600 [Mycena chlorophos]
MLQYLSSIPEDQQERPRAGRRVVPGILGSTDKFSDAAEGYHMPEDQRADGRARGIGGCTPALPNSENVELQGRRNQAMRLALSQTCRVFRKLFRGPAREHQILYFRDWEQSRRKAFKAHIARDSPYVRSVELNAPIRGFLADAREQLTILDGTAEVLETLVSFPRFDTLIINMTQPVLELFVRGARHSRRALPMVATLIASGRIDLHLFVEFAPNVETVVCGSESSLRNLHRSMTTEQKKKIHTLVGLNPRGGTFIRDFVHFPNLRAITVVYTLTPTSESFFDELKNLRSLTYLSLMYDEENESSLRSLRPLSKLVELAKAGLRACPADGPKTLRIWNSRWGDETAWSDEPFYVVTV